MKINVRKPLCFSEIGRKDNQEDFLWPARESATRDNKVFLMCDGVGGQDSGEVASETAATALGTYLTKYKPEDVIVTKAMFEEALAYGYDELDKVDTGAARKMGTTMTCLVLHQGGALVAHIGDSRIYHIRPSLADENGRSGIIYQSADHSLVNDLLRAGEITEEEAVNFPQKNVITRAMQPHLERRYRADIFNIDDLQAGDYFFLCSDGVLEQLTNDMLGAILSDSSLDDNGKLQAIRNVCDNKTRDNYTCWLIPIDSVEGIAMGETEDEVVAVAVESEPVKEKGVGRTGIRTATPPVIPKQPDNTKLLVETVLSKWKFLLLLLVVFVGGFAVSGLFSNKSDKENVVIPMDSIKDMGKGNVTRDVADTESEDVQQVETSDAAVPDNPESPVDEELEKEDSGKQSFVSKIKEKIDAWTEDETSLSETEEEKTDTAKVVKP